MVSTREDVSNGTFFINKKSEGFHNYKYKCNESHKQINRIREDRIHENDLSTKLV